MRYSGSADKAPRRRREHHIVIQFVNGGSAHYFQLLSFNLELALLRRLLSKRVRFECSLSLAEEVRALRRANRLMILPNDSDNNGGEMEGELQNRVISQTISCKVQHCAGGANLAQRCFFFLAFFLCHFFLAICNFT